MTVNRRNDQTVKLFPNSALTLSWEYRSRFQSLERLYEAAKRSQWNAIDDIDWTGRDRPLDKIVDLRMFDPGDLRALPSARRQVLETRFSDELQAWLLSQFLHGEQMALVGASRLACEAPDSMVKMMASTQAMDEARHVQALTTYLDHTGTELREVDAPLLALMTDALGHSEWDFSVLAVQILVEPMALAVYRSADALFVDSTLIDLARLIGRDEARHVSFGTLLVAEVVSELGDAERRARQEFLLEAIDQLHRQLLLAGVWERLDFPPDQGVALVVQSRRFAAFRQLLFARIITSLVRTGLLSLPVVRQLDRYELVSPIVRRRVAVASRAGGT